MILLFILPNLSVGLDLKQGYDLKLYPQLGITIEDLKSSVIVTNGFMKTRLSLEFNLPSINPILTQEECNAAQNQTVFNETITNASSRFREQIKDDLAEYLDLEGIVLNPVTVQSKVSHVLTTADDVKANPMLCENPDVTCQLLPVMDLDETSEEQLKLRPCYNVDVGKVATAGKACHIKSGVSFCCAKDASKNNNKCPLKSMSQVYRLIHGNELVFPDKPHSINGGRTASQIQNYCVALRSVRIRGTKTIVGKYHDVDINGRGLGQPKRKRREAKSRQRRSNWSYYTSGGFFTSTYIDNEISKVQEIEKIDTLQLKQAVETNSKTLLTLKGDEKEISSLQQVVCSSSEQFSEELVLTELRSAQNKLEWKTELVLRSCTNNLVPDQISTEILTQLCVAASSSSHCYGKDVRALFSCKLKKPLITVDVIGMQIELIMNIPIDEDYSAYKLHTIGVPYSSNAIDVSTNVTAVIKQPVEQKSKPVDQEGETNVKNDEIAKFLAQIYQNAITTQKPVKPTQKPIIASSRARREVLQTHHFLRVVSIPDIIVEFEGDLIGFSMKDVISTPWAKIVDYSNNQVRNTECVSSIINKDVKRIPHFCEMRVESSNFDCLVKNLGKKGYILSTSEAKTISDVTVGQQSVFQNPTREICNSVCIIPVGPSKKTFSCGHRSYTVGSEAGVNVKVKTIPLTKIKISKLTARKSEISDLTLSGFDILDNSFLNQRILKQGNTLATVMTFFVAILLICMVSKGLIQRIYRILAYYTCIKPCYMYNNGRYYHYLTQYGFEDDDNEVFHKINGKKKRDKDDWII